MPRPVTLLVIALLGSAAFPVLASPSFDCAKASSDAEKLICADAELAALDRRMAERFKATVAKIENLDTGKEEALKTTRAMQRGWIKGREDCWKAADLRDCVEAAYLMREGTLVAEWLLEEPTAIVFYTCEDNPANEVAVYFFDTELPSLRLEYGDGIKTASRVPAASGAKYATAFGGMFWIKGQKALFARGEGKEIACVANE